MPSKPRPALVYVCTLFARPTLALPLVNVRCRREVSLLETAFALAGRGSIADPERPIGYRDCGKNFATRNHIQYRYDRHRDCLTCGGSGRRSVPKLPWFNATGRCLCQSGYVPSKKGSSGPICLDAKRAGEFGARTGPDIPMDLAKTWRYAPEQVGHQYARFCRTFCHHLGDIFPLVHSLWKRLWFSCIAQNPKK